MAWIKQAIVDRPCDATYFSYAVPTAFNEWIVSNKWTSIKGTPTPAHLYVTLELTLDAQTTVTGSLTAGVWSWTDLTLPTSSGTTSPGNGAPPMVEYATQHHQHHQHHHHHHHHISLLLL